MSLTFDGGVHHLFDIAVDEDLILDNGATVYAEDVTCTDITILDGTLYAANVRCQDILIDEDGGSLYATQLQCFKIDAGAGTNKRLLIDGLRSLSRVQANGDWDEFSVTGAVIGNPASSLEDVSLLVLSDLAAGFKVQAEIYHPSRHGAQITACVGGDLDLTIIDPSASANNTYQGVSIEGTSDQITLRGSIRGALNQANNPEYGVEIAATATNIVIAIPPKAITGWQTGAINNLAGDEVTILADVATDDPDDGDVLTWDETNSVYRPEPPAASGTDENAIHDNVAGEIAALTGVTPVSGDWVLIEDASDSDNKKKVNASTFLSSASSPLTTKGDLYGYDTGDQRIPIGADGQVLTADAAEALGLKWAAPSGGGGAQWAVDTTDNTDSESVQWDGTQVAGMTLVDITGTQTLTEKEGILSAKFAGQGTQDYQSLLIARTFSVGDSFAVPVRVMGQVASISAVGVIFTDGTTASSNGVTAALQKHSNEAHDRIYTRSGTLTLMNTVSTVINQLSNSIPWTWLRLTYQAANTFRKEVSPDGVSWSQLGISDMSKTMTPTHMGICWTKDNSSGDGLATFGPIIKVA